MSLVSPLRALRPAPDVAARVASVPYDVVSTDEARELAAGNALSFLRVTRSELELPPGTNPYDDSVYFVALRNFMLIKGGAPMIIDAEPSLYFYRLRMGDHEQIGLAGGFSVDEYDRGLIKKHEKTRKDKEDDRTRHIVDLLAQTGLVFLTYRDSPAVNQIATRIASTAPLYDLTAPDGVQHTLWRVTGADRDALVAAFHDVPELYIADGHHRAASAARARTTLAARGTPSAAAGQFIAVAFPESQVRILAYNRVVKDLYGETPDSVIAALRAREIVVTPGKPVPDRQGVVSMFIGGAWYAIELPRPAAGTPRADSLDVEVLQRQVLEPILRVGDPRTDKRIDFVGGIRGTAELERLVTSGRAAVAFSLFPVSVHDLMAIADAGGIMPPKSTWFEPKLRDGLLVHML